ncbi:stromal membrane-associated protein 1-like isoform X4 [Mizuhopecten yessoensis]|uniref:stromal membrane-associated protein 1-like isoform X4 n=1 Tax=Mizuhopecten yessoensis TaxID=6573 RepID=UPI000B45AEEE|nr:stromal membrane-associated protein 1-like isoform X4 [Mizuhopecten yessoensis]
MSSRAEKERTKALQEKFQAVLSGLLKDEDNKYCVDCDAKGPRWASWNLGIFLCIRCAGIHRNLGVHITKVKSVNLDSWTTEQVAMMMEMGNSRARAVYEANVPDGFRRPQTDSRSLESFIRAKYEQKKYIAREWVPPKPSIPKELEMDDKADKRKARAKNSGIQLNSVPKPGPKAATGNVSKQSSEETSPPPKKAETKPQPVKSSQDLLGLDMSPGKKPNNQNADLLGDFNDFMGAPSQQTASTVPSSQPLQQNGNAEPNLFEDSNSSAEKVPEKSTKDSIMALFGPTGMPQQQQQQQPQQFGVPAGGTSYFYVPQTEVGIPNQYEAGGMYMPQNANPAMYGMPGAVPAQTAGMMYQQQPQGMMAMPQQQQQQQPNMYAGMMGMPQQGNMAMAGMPQGNMAMYGQQPQQMQQQQMQFQQMQQQMSAMRVGGGNMMGQPMPSTGGLNWGAQNSSGHTLSTNLWQ